MSSGVPNVETMLMKRSSPSPWRSRSGTTISPGPGELVVPLRVRHDGGELRFMSIVSTFGTPLDVTLQELSIETFLPADRATAEALRAALAD